MTYVKKKSETKAEAAASFGKAKSSEGLSQPTQYEEKLYTFKDDPHCRVVAPKINNND